MQTKGERTFMGPASTADIIVYFIIMLATQVTATFLAAKESLLVSLFVGAASILTWLIVLGFYAQELRRRARSPFAPALWRDEDAIRRRFNDSFAATPGPALPDDIEANPAAYLTVRHRAILSLASRRRRALERT